MRIVIDTNVLLASVATHGLCEALVKLCLERHELFISEHILNELAKHYAGKFKADPRVVGAAVDLFREAAEVVTPTEIPSDAFGDPDDLPVLGTAVASAADCLVTGDKRLLELGRYRDVRILSPRELYDLIRTR